MFNEEPPKDDVTTIHVCHKALHMLYVPLIQITEMTELLDEYFVFLNDCFVKKTTAYTALLDEWSRMPLYRALRAKALNAFLRVVSHFDAFIVGLLFNEMPESLKARIDEYRIFRDDFSTVKALYQDLFELTSQFLIFLGAVINLSVRNDPWHYVTGVRSFNSFSKKKAFERFRILSELPKTSGIVAGVSRPMRNVIGHFSADYEPSTGDLRYDDGSRQNYVVFLGQFFAAVKALWFVLVFFEKSDIDMTRLGIAVPAV